MVPQGPWLVHRNGCHPRSLKDMEQSSHALLGAPVKKTIKDIHFSTFNNTLTYIFITLFTVYIVFYSWQVCNLILRSCEWRKQYMVGSNMTSAIVGFIQAKQIGTAMLDSKLCDKSYWKWNVFRRTNTNMFYYFFVYWSSQLSTFL